MKVAFITADWGEAYDAETEETHMVLGGSGYWRIGIPAMALRAAGHTVSVSPTVAALKTGEICPADWENEIDLTGYDVIVLQRWMNYAGANVIRQARAAGQVVVNDCDDWFDGLHPQNAAYSSTDPRNDPENNRLHYREIMKASNAITVSTPFLQDKLGRLAPAKLLRNRIDLPRWEEYRKRLTQPADPVVGWVGSTPWRSGDLETMRGIMGPYLDRTGFKFAHHGHYGEPYPSAGELMNLRPEQMMEPWGMLPVTEYPSLFDQISIGVVPLNDIPFNHAKSAIKGYEYVAAGIPFVAQATPEYQWFDLQSACRKPRQWINRLNALADETYRKEEWERQYELVKAQDIALHWHEWETFYQGLIDGIPAEELVSS